jgi:hypothetical protein
MDADRFDSLVRRLGSPATRRTLLGATVGGVVAVAGLESAAAKHHKKHHKKHHATCHDGKLNGNETDVDCGGGTCPRCADGKACRVDNDCVSGTCTDGQCVACTPTQLCGSDANGSCRCDTEFSSGDPVCDSGPMLGLTVDDCAKCPAGTETCVTINGILFDCFKRCGSA